MSAMAAAGIWFIKWLESTDSMPASASIARYDPVDAMAHAWVAARDHYTNAPGTPAVRFRGLMDELEKRLPDPNPFAAAPPEPRHLAALDALIAELAAEKERSAAAIDALLYYQNECSGAEPSLSVFHQKVDLALRGMQIPRGKDEGAPA